MPTALPPAPCAGAAGRAFDRIDHLHMARALRLAARGAWTTRPNPMVGCVLAQGEDVVGEGFHERAGLAHAEAHALRAAGERARGATAYVTLEPCGLHRRTPPCSEALIAAGVARVVMATADPDQRAGHGVERMRQAGIAVESGLMHDAARRLNRGFFLRVERGRPHVTLKLAMSLDGRTALADGRSRWITSEAARADVHRLRAASGAILTGIGSVLADDPRLDVRLPGDAAAFVPPLRVVLDSQARLPAAAALRGGGAPTLLLHAEGAAAGDPTGIETEALPRSEAGLDLGAALDALGRRHVNELLVECGPTLAGALLAEGLVDELLLYVAPVLLGARGRPLVAGLDPASMQERLDLRLLETRRIGPDLRLRLQPARAASATT